MVTLFVVPVERSFRLVFRQLRESARELRKLLRTQRRCAFRIVSLDDECTRLSFEGAVLCTDSPVWVRTAVASRSCFTRWLLQNRARDSGAIPRGVGVATGRGHLDD
jgi:hypothetical protein